MNNQECCFSFSLWSVVLGRHAAKSQPLLFGAVLLLSLKCSARVQSEGGQEGSFGPVFLRFLRFQKLQTWIYPNSTSVADTGQSGEKERKKKEKKIKYTECRMSFWDRLCGKGLFPTNPGCASSLCVESWPWFKQRGVNPGTGRDPVCQEQVEALGIPWAFG